MMRWIILRCSGTKTLGLAKSLTEDGYEAWSPVELRERLAGRERKTVERKVPILPGYVFAPDRHLTALLELSHSPALTYQVWDSEQRRMVTKGHDFFTVFRANGQIRPVADAGLSPLRELEESLQRAALRRREEAKHQGPAPQFKAGQIVRVEGGGFDGLDLTVVEDNSGKAVKLTHPEWMWTVEISAWKLREIQLEGEPIERADA